jgi:hypothetical protein
MHPSALLYYLILLCMARPCVANSMPNWTVGTARARQAIVSIGLARHGYKALVSYLSRGSGTILVTNRVVSISDMHVQC